MRNDILHPQRTQRTTTESGIPLRYTLITAADMRGSLPSYSWPYLPVNVAAIETGMTAEEA